MAMVAVLVQTGRQEAIVMLIVLLILTSQLMAVVRALKEQAVHFVLEEGVEVQVVLAPMPLAQLPAVVATPQFKALLKAIVWVVVERGEVLEERRQHVMPSLVGAEEVVTMGQEGVLFMVQEAVGAVTERVMEEAEDGVHILEGVEGVPEPGIYPLRAMAAMA